VAGIGGLYSKYWKKEEPALEGSDTNKQQPEEEKEIAPV
jgi:hypothetical protein